MMSNLLHVSSSPHIRSKITTDWIMYMVLIALLPATCMGVYLFGVPALILIVCSVVTCVATEYIYERLMHKPITIKDGSAMVTGLLLALNLPSGATWWMAVLGGVFAIYELFPAFIISSIVIVVVSLCTKEPSEEIQREFEQVAGK